MGQPLARVYLYHWPWKVTVGLLSYKTTNVYSKKSKVLGHPAQLVVPGGSSLYSPHPVRCAVGWELPSPPPAVAPETLLSGNCGFME